MKYHRHSIRLNDYDYSKNGFYFVTICVQNKLKLFWKNQIINNKRADTSVHNDKSLRADTSVRPYTNGIGLMVEYWLNEIPNHFNNIFFDEYIIMPDHIHFILIINNNKNIGRTHNLNNKYVGVDRCVDPYEKKKLGNIIQWFKTMSTNEYIKNVKQNNWPKFDKRLWQRNYYERIIRNENEYLIYKKYIKENPENIKDKI